MTTNPYLIGDPVVDLAQGRPMIVVATPDETVAEWSERENYDLQENYANSKFDPATDEPVVETVYVSDVRSEPSKTYTFPVSRVALIDVHHADDGKRVYDRVAVDVLERVFDAMHRGMMFDEDDIDALAKHIGGVEPDVVDEARELADVDATIPSESVDPSSGGGYET